MLHLALKLFVLQKIDSLTLLPLVWFLSELVAPWKED